jgi:glycosyltransferase involved in cell wall biosynthesis
MVYASIAGSDLPPRYLPFLAEPSVPAERYDFIAVELPNGGCGAMQCRRRVCPVKIAQIAPLYERVPPKLYGGTERIVSYLTEELVEQGHEVTLFASGDSVTQAELVPCCDRALRLNPSVQDALPYHVTMLERLRGRAADFDVLHFHIDIIHLPLVRALARKSLTTMHGRLDLPDLAPLFRVFSDVPLVSISRDQRQYLPAVNWAGTVYHGLPHGLLPYRPVASGGYLAFLGRMSPEKRPDRAIEIARRANMPLLMAAKIDKADQEYWSTTIKPLIDRSPQVTYIGEITESEKADFLGGAKALLFPIDWPEPFGLAMIEAMACGTPVIAFRKGSVDEVLSDGISGFVVDSIEQAVAAVAKLDNVSRQTTRQAFETRFTVASMAKNYLDIYETLPERRRRDSAQRRAKERQSRVSVAA